MGITLSSLALGAVGQAQLAPLLAPWFTRWGVAGAAASQTTAAIVALLALTGPSGHAHVHSPEELDLQVAESGEGGAGERVTWQGLELTGGQHRRPWRRALPGAGSRRRTSATRRSTSVIPGLSGPGRAP